MTARARRTFAPLVVVALAAFVAPLTTFGPVARAEKPAVVSATCVQFHGEVRARAYGYDHFVVLTSVCKKAATCAVSSDVSPEAQSVGIAPGETKEVATFLGSPASEFKPIVSCTSK